MRRENSLAYFNIGFSNIAWGGGSLVSGPVATRDWVGKKEKESTLSAICFWIGNIIQVLYNQRPFAPGPPFMALWTPLEQRCNNLWLLSLAQSCISMRYTCVCEKNCQLTLTFTFRIPSKAEEGIYAFLAPLAPQIAPFSAYNRPLFLSGFE